MIEDVCPHMGARLAKGHLDGNRLWCPKHGFCFDLDSGHRISPPVTGGDAECLVRYPVMEQDGWIGVELP